MHATTRIMRKDGFSENLTFFSRSFDNHPNKSKKPITVQTTEKQWKRRN